MPLLIEIPPLLRPAETVQMPTLAPQVQQQPMMEQPKKTNELTQVLDKIEQTKFYQGLTQNRSTIENAIKTKLVESGITDPKEIAQFLATAQVESNFKFNPENLSGYKNTSTSRIKSIFGTKIKKLNLSDADIDELKKEPEKLFDILYGNIGGSKYRGRGPLQVTGIDNYKLISNRLFGDDRLVQNPQLLEDPETSIKASIEFWKMNNLGEVGKQKGFDEVQRLINVGPKGSLSRVQELDKRRKFYNKYLLGVK